MRYAIYFEAYDDEQAQDLFRQIQAKVDLTRGVLAGLVEGSQADYSRPVRKEETR